MFSASPCAKYAASACSPLATPLIWLAAWAAAPALAPAISTCTSPPPLLAISSAALTVLSVAPLTDWLPCSAITRVVISDPLRVVLEFGHQRGHVGHLDAGAALGRLADLEHLQMRLDVHPQVRGLEHLHGLLLGLHDVGQRDVARLVQAQIGGDDGRQAQRQGLQPAVDLAGDGGLAAR